MVIYTKRGDKGETDLFDLKTGKKIRVEKDDLRLEVIGAIDAPGSLNVAASVAALGALTAVGAVDVADAGPADVALSASVDARIASLQAKIDAVIAALKAANLMAP